MDLNCCFTTQQLINILMTYSRTWWVSDESDRLSDDNNDINIRVWVGSSLTSDSVTSDSGRLKLIILENLIYWLQHSRSLKVLEKQEQTKKSWIVRILESVNYFDSTSWGSTETRNTGSVFSLLWSTGQVRGTGPRDGSVLQELLNCWCCDVELQLWRHDCLFLFERLYVNHVWYQLLEQMKKINKWWVDCSWSVVIQLQTRDPVHDPERRAVHDLSMLNNFI